MGDPHNPAREGETWNPLRLNVLRREIDAVRQFGALSGGWAWHFISPPHVEEKHLHDHRDVDLHVFPSRFAELVATLEARGYRRQKTRFDDPSGEFVRFENHVWPCSFCGSHTELLDKWIATDEVPHDAYLCSDCGETTIDPSPVKVIFDLFVHEVPTIDVDGYTVVEPVHMLSFYGVKHSSEQCVAVQAARRLAAAGRPIPKDPSLVGAWAVPT